MPSGPESVGAAGIAQPELSNLIAHGGEAGSTNK